MDIVFIPAPFVKCVIIKSSSDIVKASKNPDITPGNISGNTTLKNAVSGVAPRSRAASYVTLSVCLSFGITESNTYGILKVIWLIRIVLNPRLMPNAINPSIKEIPVTISALSIGILLTAITTVLGTFLILLIPIAATVPISVAISADKNAITSVFLKADIIVALLKSSEYQSSVNPPHLFLDFEVLKLKITKVAIGAYKNINMNTR